MLNKSYIYKLRKHTLNYAQKRHDIIKESSDALHHAKRAIFAMHRDNLSEAKIKLADIKKILVSLQKKYKKDPLIFEEGSYKAALEEYVEAEIFYQFLTDRNLDEIKGLEIAPEVFVAGLCDVPGELYRYAIKAATDKDIKTVKKCATSAQEIIGELTEFNLTKYLRNKFDQAKHAVQKLEYIVYEVSLRK